MEVTVNHTKNKEEALTLMKNFLSQLKAEHGDKVSDLTENWDGNSGDYSCKFNGITLNGHIDINDDNVKVSGKLPFFAMPFKSTIENLIKQSVEQTLG